MSKELPTKLPTTERPPDAEEWPPRGISFEDRPEKPMPYLARWREAGLKKARAFDSVKARNSFAESLAASRKKHGTFAQVKTKDESDTWREFARITGGASPLDVAKFYAKHRGEREGNMLLTEAVTRFAQTRTGKNLADDTETHLALHLRRFAEAMGKTTLRDITADGIRSWLYGQRTASGEQIGGLRDPDSGEPMSTYTLRHHLRSVKFLLKRCVAEGWLDRSPAEALDLPTPETEEVCVLSVVDAVKLFTVNRDNPIVGKLALEAFGGLRYTSAARITRNEILDAERGVIMPGAKHKTGRRHYVDGYPDNLWLWIAHSSPVCWAIPQRAYLDAKRAAFEAAGVKNPGNVLRHSFCTYHIAREKDAARTAVLLTHRSPSMLYQHYRGRGSEADGTAYFQITPESTKKPTV